MSLITSLNTEAQAGTFSVHSVFPRKSYGSIELLPTGRWKKKKIGEQSDGFSVFIAIGFILSIGPQKQIRTLPRPWAKSILSAQNSFQLLGQILLSLAAQAAWIHSPINIALSQVDLLVWAVLLSVIPPGKGHRGRYGLQNQKCSFHTLSVCSFLVLTL